MSIFNKLKRKEEKPKETAEQAAPTKKEEERKTAPAAKQQVYLKKKSERKIVGVLVKPMVTEKSSFIGQYGQYVFEVAPKANKIEIAKAVESIYGVKPISVNITHVRGKKIRYGRTIGRTKKIKKAIVTLKEGDKIEIHEGV
jgi:large subunit ribosomal protein L23